MTKMGDPPGDTAVYPASAPRGVITADCIKLRPDPRLVTAYWVAASMGSGSCAKQVQESARGVAQQKISLEVFRLLAVPVAPRAEQTAVIDNLKNSTNESLWPQWADLNVLTNEFEQALLAKAFRGELLG